MQLRLSSQRWFVSLSCGLALLLAVHVYMSAWTVVQFDGVYEEGKPAPTEIHALIVVDSKQTYIDVDMEKATSFFVYSFSRNDTSLEQQQPVESQDEKQESTIDYTHIGRVLIVTSLFLFVVAHGLFLTSFRFSNAVVYSLFCWLLVLFFIVFPSLYILDLGAGSGQNIAFENFSSNDVEDSLLHQTVHADWKMTTRGISVESSYSGYDLGLVSKDEVEQARNSSIEEAATLYSASFIEFQSTFSFEVGKNIQTLYIFPLLWFLMPMKPLQMGKSSEEE